MTQDTHQKVKVTRRPESVQPCPARVRSQVGSVLSACVLVPRDGGTAGGSSLPIPAGNPEERQCWRPWQLPVGRRVPLVPAHAHYTHLQAFGVPSPHGIPSSLTPRGHCWVRQAEKKRFPNPSSKSSQFWGSVEILRGVQNLFPTFGV